ncbi:MAG: hypothetical protein QM765_51840 [Myxococcales bacterium]
MRRSLARICPLALSLVCLAGCPGETPSSLDASQVRPDADLVIGPADASAEKPDTGSQPVADTGVVAVADTGSPGSPDTGLEAVDSGTVAADTGVADGDAGVWACGPVNPCDTADNRAKHQTRCLGTREGGYTCNCDASPVLYHSDNGICCPPYASNSGGQCVCQQGYLPNPEGVCEVACSEDSIEGLTGRCPAGQVCQQGVCITDLCVGVTCPANATCSVKAGAANCVCDSGLHLDQNLCCQAHASNVSGACKCDIGYVASAGACVADPNNECDPNPCENNSGHKTLCVTDFSAQGYHCACAENYVDQAGICTLQKVTTCPATLQCLAGYCISDPALQTCMTAADCKEFNPDPAYHPTCNAEAAGGICIGCTAASDCPDNAQCMTGLGEGICALMCASDADCPFGTCYSNGYCGQRRCSSNTDCFTGTLCLDGMCRRIPCVETLCSATNPNGTCPNANEACIAGACVASCTPNPCQGINQTTCVVDQGKPSCPCDSGTAKDASGICAPPVQASCPNGLTCQSAYCVDRSTYAFACGVGADCGSVAMACSASSPTGRCVNCFGDDDCPVAAEKCVGTDPTDPFSTGYCMRPCVSDTDCNPASKCTSGYCGTRTCSKKADCGANFGCFPSSSGGGICQRLRCQ